MEYKPKQDGTPNRDRLLNDILKEYGDQPAAKQPVKPAAPQPDAARTARPAASGAHSAASRTAAVPKQPSSNPPAGDSLIDSDMEYVFAQRRKAPPKPDAGKQPAAVRAERTMEQTAPFTAPDATSRMQATAMRSRLEQDLEGESQVSNIPEELTGKKKKRRKKHRGLFTLVMVLVVLLISICASAVIIVYGRDMLGIDSNTTTVIVNIPQGADTAEIADILQKEGIIERPRFFVFFAGLGNKDANFRSGDHELRADMAYETLISELTSEPLDDSEAVTLTFPEGTTLYDAAVLLEENNVCQAEEFLEHFNNDANYGYRYEEYLPSLQSDKFYRMEGYFFPDTYTFYQDMDLDLICQKILKNFDSHITDEYYDRMQALNLSLDETITLASMIQAEAGSVEQMKTISSVFWNRLNNPTEYPLLQSDPTKNYVEEVIKPHIDSYNTTIFEAYDTYTSSGLPPGAICNPGADAIEAALYPESTDYYYFYSNMDTKQTYFAKTLKEHEANEAKVKQEQADAAEKAKQAEQAAQEGEGEGAE